MRGLDLNDIVGNKKTLPKKAEEPVVTKKEPNIIYNNEENKVQNIIKPSLQILVCGNCGVNLSVGKKHTSKLFSYNLFCPSCKTKYVKENYVVDTNSTLWHRPFTQIGQEEFDKEVSNLKTKLPFEQIILEEVQESEQA